MRHGDLAGGAMTDQPRPVELTSREVELILQYACPFPDHADQLRASQSKGSWHAIEIDPYWISHWIGDLVHSTKAIRSQRLLEEIDRLCAVLETATTHAARRSSLDT
jgi:hypothetical protein